MRILVVCQHYSPEPFSISDICEQLVKFGHSVTVVTGIPNYPMGKIYAGYRHGQRRDETISGVNVHRCFTIGRRSGVLFRLVNYYSYMLSSTHYVRRLSDDYDVVFVNQLSPVMMANAGIKYKQKHHIPLVLYCLDLWPESLCVGGICKNGLIYRYYHRVSKKIYSKADKILITSRSFADYFIGEFGIADTIFLPQYAENVFEPEACKKAPDTYCDIMFAGNVGAAQSCDTIISAAKLTREVPNIRWHIVGDGSELDRIKEAASGLDNVIFHGRKPLDEMPKYYAMADAMLVTMSKDLISSNTLPGKVQSYLAAGKPIICAADGETARIIQDAQCGFCGEAGNAEQLAANAVLLSKIEKYKMADNSRHYYEQYYNKKTFFHALLACLEQTKANGE